MTTASTFDHQLAALSAGEDLSSDAVRALAATPDVLSLGMLADVVRRRLHDRRATFLRVASCGLDGIQPAALGSALEVRIEGAPPDLETAVGAVDRARAVAGDRTVAGFSWSDVGRLAGDGDPVPVLRRLRAAGLDAVARLPLDAVADARAVVSAMAASGFERLRLTIDRPGGDGVELCLRAAALQAEFACIAALNPLPFVLQAFRPTTGYEDVRMVALARLAAPAIPHVQVDWSRYGPKLAQVALTFGADDLDAVSGADEAPEGRRRAPLAEVRRNIEAAGLVPVERDGRFAVPGS